MAYQVTTEEYFSGQGVCMIARRDPTNGHPLGFRLLGNVSSLVIKNGTTTIDHKDSTTGTRATDLRLTTDLKISLDMTMENFNSANLADATRGDAAVVASGTVTAELVNGYPGLVTAFANINIAALVVKLVPSTTLVPFVDSATPWDYKYNLAAGSILLNTAAGLDASGTPPNLVFTSGVAALTVAYTFSKQAQVHALTQPIPQLYLRFEGLNTAEGNSPVIVEVFKYSTDPTQDLALISDTVQGFVMSGSVLKDSMRTTGSLFYKVTKLDLG